VSGLNLLATLIAVFSGTAAHENGSPVFLECTRVYHGDNQFDGQVTHNDFALDEKSASGTVTVRETGYSSGAVHAVFSPTTVSLTDNSAVGQGMVYTIDRTTLEYKVTTPSYVYTGTCVLAAQKVDRKF
jgi:hypothetical protein